MRFYKHKTTGQIITGNHLDILNPDTMINYELYNDYQLEYLSSISDKMGWVVGFLAIQFILTAIGFYYLYL